MLVFEMLTSAMIGNPIVTGYHSGPRGSPSPSERSLLAIDISAFPPVEQFPAIVDAMLSSNKTLPRRTRPPRFDSGERGTWTYAERSANGCHLAPSCGTD